MIFTKLKHNYFFVDILLHSFFSFTIITIIFLVRFRKEKQERLDKEYKEILNSGIFNNISAPTHEDKENLRILNKIYKNRDNFDKSIDDDLRKSAYNQIIIFGFSVLIISLFLDKTKLFKLLFEKIIIFVILGCSYYLYGSYVEKKYTEFYKEEIYDIIKKEIGKLISRTNF